MEVFTAGPGRAGKEEACGGGKPANFQARGFYEKHGYVVFASLPGFPPGHTHFHLSKHFTLPTSLPRG